MYLDAYINEKLFMNHSHTQVLCPTCTVHVTEGQGVNREEVLWLAGSCLKDEENTSHDGLAF